MKLSGTVSDCIVWTISECWTVTCSSRATHGTQFSKGFTSFNGWL